VQTLCRDCGRFFDSEIRTDENISQSSIRCRGCGSVRLVQHVELTTLTLAHLDCDAYYASVEKRDDPSLLDKPVIVGGGKRGVVAACCYVARTYGIRSAMPMFKALQLCPSAVVIRPDMDKYARATEKIEKLILNVTPAYEFASLDEAYLNLAGTDLVNHGAPARTLALLAKRIEKEVGITVSIGLSYNKGLAKIASDLDKPRGFAALGRAEARSFLRDKLALIIPGVGPALAERLARDGIRTVGDIQARGAAEIQRYGASGAWLSAFAAGEDDRTVEVVAETKSISAEDTFERDISDAEELKLQLWPLCERVARRLKEAGLAGEVVAIKLKTWDFKQRSRSRKLADPTQLAETLLQNAISLLAPEADGTSFRLIGVGAESLVDGALADPVNLFSGIDDRAAKVERVMDQIREKLGEGAIQRGRGIGLAPRRGGAGGRTSGPARGTPRRRTP
jgi:DNA polymerase-4